MARNIQRKVNNGKNTKSSVARKNVAARTAAKNSPKKESKKKSEDISLEKRDELILNHRESGRKLARSILRKWRVRLATDEIDSVVDLTLCEAAARFQPTKGASFMTFFFYHLRGNLVRTVATATQASNIFLSFTREQEEVNEDWTFARHDVLRQYIADFIKDQHDEVVTPEDMMIRREKIDQCRAACAKLDDLEQTILIRSFQDEESLVDISNSLGYSRCHISRVKQRAFDTLREILNGEPVSEKSEETLRSDLPKRRARRKLIDESELSLIEEKLAA